jgi:SAM-dependent methyltransferase
VLGIDHSAAMLAQASGRNRRAIREGRVRLVRGRFDALPWPTSSVEKVVGVNVAYFFRDTGVEVSEARRVLRPGGLLALYATHKSTMARWKLADPETHRLRDEADMLELLLRGGFSRQAIQVRPVSMPFGVAGILATAAR